MSTLVPHVVCQHRMQILGREGEEGDGGGLVLTSVQLFLPPGHTLSLSVSVTHVLPLNTHADTGNVVTVLCKSLILLLLLHKLTDAEWTSDLAERDALYCTHIYINIHYFH